MKKHEGKSNQGMYTYIDLNLSDSEEKHKKIKANINMNKAMKRLKLRKLSELNISEIKKVAHKRNIYSDKKPTTKIGK